MKTKIQTVLLLVIAGLLGLIAFRPSGEGVGPAKKQETAFERVMRTQTIRCAYGVWPPRFIIDPTGKNLSGIDYEIMENVGRVTGLKIVWDGEFAGPGVVAEQLQGGKQDVCCVALWANARRAQRMEMSTPVDYMPLYAYVRDGDTRFDNKIESINDEHVTIALSDGSAQKAIADSTFPKAKRHAISQDQSTIDTFLAVATGKADVVFSDPAVIRDFNAHNPGRMLLRVPSDKPIKIFADILAVAKGEGELRDLLSAAVQELQGDGTIEHILNKYASEPGALLPVAVPYRNGL
ncbi:MAG: transporter substrate-binding domain-containing protein [Alphaproteobacteria bacterium]|nr:transporter substrate-binding domain-containing protein [Alphaproteobacteria bacterium]